MFKCIHGLAPNYVYVMMLLCILISMAMTPGVVKLLIYTCPISSGTITREAWVT